MTTLNQNGSIALRSDKSQRTPIPLLRLLLSSTGLTLLGSGFVMPNITRPKTSWSLTSRRGGCGCSQ